MVFFKNGRALNSAFAVAGIGMVLLRAAAEIHGDEQGISDSQITLVLVVRNEPLYLLFFM